MLSSLWSVTLSPVIFISIITSIIFSSPGKIPINSIDSQARYWLLTVYKVAVSVAYVLPFQYQRTNTTREENKDVWYYFFKCWIISSAGSLLASETFTLWKIHCNYRLTTTEGEHFACSENIVSSRSQTSSPPPSPVVVTVCWNEVVVVKDLINSKKHTWTYFFGFLFGIVFWLFLIIFVSRKRGMDKWKII